MHASVYDVAAKRAETCGTTRGRVRFREVFGLLPIAASGVPRCASFDRVVIIVFVSEDDFCRDHFLAGIVSFFARNKPPSIVDGKLGFIFLITAKPPELGVRKRVGLGEVLWERDTGR